MNRRHFFRTVVPASMLVPSLLPCVLHATASAQEEEVELFEYNFKGVELSAVQYWEARYTRDTGALTLSTTLDVFESDRRARAAFRQFEQYVDDYYEFWDENDYFAELDREETSPPKLGARRSARLSTVRLTAYETDAQIAIMFVQEHSVLHKWLAVGFGNPTQELFDLADETMGFNSLDDSSTDEEILALLPTDRDVPRALSLITEFVERY